MMISVRRANVLSALCFAVLTVGALASVCGASGQTPGDANGDGVVDNADLTALILYVTAGVVPARPDNCDVDDDCCVTRDDIAYLQAFLFSGGPRPICGCANPMAMFPGDVNCDYAIDNADLVLLTNVVAGFASPCLDANADVNGDCCINSEDVLYLQLYLFSGGPPPVICTCHNPRLNHPGDVNCDGAIDASDVTDLASMISSGIPYPACNTANADIDGDSCVSKDDLTLLTNYLFSGGPPPVECAPSNPIFPVLQMPGDANSNGTISGPDVVFLANYFVGGGPAPSPLANGDANGDCCLNLDDLDYLTAFVYSGGPAPPHCTCTNPLTVCGDADGSGAVNIADVTCLIARIFACANLSCMADADGDQKVNITDVTYLIAYIFSGGPAPKC